MYKLPSRGLLVVLALVGCGQNRHADPPPPRVVLPVAPPKGAAPPRSLVIVRPGTSLGEPPGLLWMGLSDDKGRFHVDTDHPGPFDVTVQVPGYRRPSSSDPFAPSAVLHDVSVDGMLDLGLTLEPSPARADRPGLPGRVLEGLGETLVEGVPVGVGWLSGARDLHLAVSCPSALTVTLIRHDAGLTGSLGWFVWEPGPDGAPLVTDAGPAFALGEGLELGTSWSLVTADGSARSFVPGERIGVFYAREAGGELVTPSSSPVENGTMARGVLLTVDGLNAEVANDPELAAHFVVLPFAPDPGVLGGGPYAVLGLEQGRRDTGTDDDFNDVVIAVSAVDPGCLDLGALGAPLGPLDDPDEDGVKGLADAFPADPDRAFVIGAPALGRQSIAFEDTYPAHGDDDFNDAVIRYALAEVRSPTGEVRDLGGTFHLVARGAGLDHAFFLGYPALPPGVTGSVSVERFTSAGVGSLEQLGWDALVVTSADGSRLLRLPVFPSTKDMLPSSNTGTPIPAALPASARFVVRLSQGVPAGGGFGSAGHDPALGVKRDGEIWDVHLPGRAGFADRPAHLPMEEGAGSFADAHGTWAVQVPTDFRYPLEKIAITQAFPPYAAWLAAGDASASDWFLHPLDGLVVVHPASDFHRRVWSIALSAP